MKTDKLLKINRKIADIYTELSAARFKTISSEIVDEQEFKEVNRRLRKIEKQVRKLNKAIDKSTSEIGIVEVHDENKVKTADAEKKASVDKNRKTVKNIINEEHNTSESTSKTAENKGKTVENVDFTDIEDVNIGDTVGDLPVKATYKKRGAFDAKITITATGRAKIEPGSIICISNSKNLSKLPVESRELRHRMIQSNDIEYAKVDGYRAEKLVVRTQISLASARMAQEFILGRQLTKSDSSVSIMVGSKTLDNYLKVGSKT